MIRSFNRARLNSFLTTKNKVIFSNEGLIEWIKNIVFLGFVNHLAVNHIFWLWGRIVVFEFHHFGGKYKLTSQSSILISKFYRSTPNLTNNTQMLTGHEIHRNKPYPSNKFLFIMSLDSEQSSLKWLISCFC